MEHSNVSEFCKEIANWSVGNDDKAEAVRNINCIYLFNDYIDTVYDDVRHSLIGDPTRIDDYTILYNLEKATKIKMYEAMDQLREKSDQYTKNRIAEQLESLRSASYILWE